MRTSRWGVVFAGISLVLGCVATLGLQLWFSAKPTLIRVNLVQVEAGPNGSRLLDVQLTGPAAHSCLRQSQHLVYQDPSPDNKWTMRHYVPLGSALNGTTFSEPIPDFNVLLDVTALPPGKWWYVDRSAYFCTVWPFVSISESNTQPVMVRIE